MSKFLARSKTASGCIPLWSTREWLYPKAAFVMLCLKTPFSSAKTLEGSDANTSNIHLVQSFVSALLSITNGHLADAFDDVRKHVKEDVKTEVKAVKKKCLRGNLVATVTFLKTVVEKTHLI